MHPGSKAVWVEHGQVGVARNEQYFEIGTAYPGCIGQLTSVDTSRQAYVGNKKITLAGGLQVLQPQGAVGCYHYAVAPVLEYFADKHGNDLLILDQKHALAGVGVETIIGLIENHVLGCLAMISRQGEMNGRARADL